MSTIGKAYKLEKLHRLIKSRHIGDSNDYAVLLHISRSCLFNYIEELKGLGADIEYNRSGKYFQYKNDVEISIIVRS